MRLGIASTEGVLQLRYVGGKGRVTDGVIQIISELMPEGGIYWEPMCGSGKMIERVRHCRRYGSDLDPHIITLLKAVQNGWEPPKKIDEKVYNYWKKRKNWLHPMVAACGYGCSFGGKFFGGFIRHEHDVGMELWNTLLKQQPHLQGVEFRVRDYREGFWGPRSPDLIYLDPPYAGTTMVGSKRQQFDHAEFWQWCAEQSKRSIVLVSEYQCPVPEAKCLWSKTKHSDLRRKDGSQKTEKLFCLSPDVGKKIGFGLL